MSRQLANWLSMLSLLAACSGGNNEQENTDKDSTANQEPADTGGGREDSLGPPLDSSEPADGTAQPTSSYLLTVELETGPGITCAAEAQVACFEGASCCRYLFDRDLSELTNKFAFGSTHIAPAISLSMTDTMYTPTFTVITLNFGIIIGTADKPPATNSSGEYDFSGFEPSVTLTMHNKEYSSLVDGSSGLFDITDWSAQEGGRWAGTVAGTILQKTDKADKLRARVEGHYDFTLPPPAGGQPGS